MMTVEFIPAFFYEVDEQLRATPKPPAAPLWPSEVVTLGLLHALKGVANRPFYRWLTRDYRPLFARLPERTRLFRLLKTHQDWTRTFLAAPTVLGVIDTYGIELIHPMREGRSPQQIGCKGLSNHRWIVGGKLCLLLNQWGLIVGWACATANVADNTFQWLIQQVDGRMIVLSDTGFHAAEGDPSNLKLCPRGEWELTFRTPSEGDPRIFPWAFFVRTAPPTSGMLASPERRYTKRLHPGRVLWVSCYRPSKRTKSNICPL